MFTMFDCNDNEIRCIGISCVGLSDLHSQFKAFVFVKSIAKIRASLDA